MAFDDVNLFLGCAELHHQSQHRSIALVWFKTKNDRKVLIHQILVLMRRKKKNKNSTLIQEKLELLLNKAT